MSVGSEFDAELEAAVGLWDVKVGEASVGNALSSGVGDELVEEVVLKLGSVIFGSVGVGAIVDSVLDCGGLGMVEDSGVPPLGLEPGSFPGLSTHSKYSSLQLEPWGQPGKDETMSSQSWYILTPFTTTNLIGIAATVSIRAATGPRKAAPLLTTAGVVHKANEIGTADRTAVVAIR